MGRDDSMDAVLARTDHVWPDVYQALKDGIKTAIDLHDFIGWDYRDDSHLYKHMIRRTAVLAIKAHKPDLNPEAEEDEPTLRMSGIILTLKEDLVKVWHVTPAEISAPTTRAKRSFINQPHSRHFQAGLYDEVRDVVSHFRRPEELNKLILRWTVVDHCISRFDLIRPTGAKKKHIVFEWSDDLLERYQLR
ncbi:hypothetical protein [Streptomyces sp.]|uniref:hypothetical protein n=1 Tax=Streptomyces sp. TaxID=1931 RepID=UPI002F91FA0C